MADYQLIIIGGGLSGLAAGIRAARFGQKVLILEQHYLPGGLNSYYYRHGHILETGLHAMTNYASPEEKHAPLNKLFRQLKLSRKKFVTRQQLCSEIVFPGRSLRFSNELSLFIDDVSRNFPQAIDNFVQLIKSVKSYDSFRPAPWRSARKYLSGILKNRELEDMILLPLMIYGNSEETDMDLRQFVIMFQSIFLEGFFRPADTIKEFLDMLVTQFKKFGGEIRYRARVEKMIADGNSFKGVLLQDGEEITCNAVLSTVGIPGTAKIAGWNLAEEKYCGRMSFMESITLVPLACRDNIQRDRTIIFYNTHKHFSYIRPAEAVDPSWGVICFPENFEGRCDIDPFQIRVTHAANYDAWCGLEKEAYNEQKQYWNERSAEQVGKIIGNYTADVVYTDSFTPVTIERFTSKEEGAVYGSPSKIRDGRTPFDNLFIAGTDQGYLGIIGSMLSGVTIVNQHLLA